LQITSLALAPNGKTLASGDMEGTVMLWDLGEGKRIASLTSHKGPIWSMDFSQGDGALLATGKPLGASGRYKKISKGLFAKI
jgi:WD40 repeat protein